MWKGWMGYFFNLFWSEQEAPKNSSKFKIKNTQKLWPIEILLWNIYGVSAPEILKVWSRF